MNGHHVHLTPDTKGSHSLCVVKNKVYERNPHTVNELKECISDAFTEIDGDRNLCFTVVRSVLDRYEDFCKVLPTDTVAQLVERRRDKSKVLGSNPGECQVDIFST